jgi:hypothetical protein
LAQLQGQHAHHRKQGQQGRVIWAISRSDRWR